MALLVTLSLVATQLSAAAYTPRIVTRRLKDFWLWFALAIYLAAIGWSLFVLTIEKGQTGEWEQKSVDVSVILAALALAYLVPFTLATLKSLQPSNIAGWLTQRRDYPALDELMRKAVNDGIMTLLNETMTLISRRGVEDLDESNGEVSDASHIADIYLSIGRHACQRQSPDAVNTVMNHLTQLVTYCNAPPRYWREPADISNEAIIELYAYSEHWIGRKE